MGAGVAGMQTLHNGAKTWERRKSEPWRSPREDSAEGGNRQ